MDVSSRVVPNITCGLSYTLILMLHPAGSGLLQYGGLDFDVACSSESAGLYCGLCDNRNRMDALASHVEIKAASSIFISRTSSS
jgi:hypothetical protein